MTTVPPEVLRACQVYAEAASTITEGMPAGQRRSITALSAAAFVFAATLAEATMMVRAEMLEESCVLGARTIIQAMAERATEKLGEPDLQRLLRVLASAVAVGMVEIVRTGAAVAQEQQWTKSNSLN